MTIIYEAFAERALRERGTFLITRNVEKGKDREGVSFVHSTANLVPGGHKIELSCDE